MLNPRGAVVLVVLGLMGCAVRVNAPAIEDKPIWGRIDCQRGEGNPALQQEFEQAKLTCVARGESTSAVDGTAGDNRCMNEQGYILRTRNEHIAACQPNEGMQPPPKATKKRT
jgi:hypothetical protein